MGIGKKMQTRKPKPKPKRKASGSVSKKSAKKNSYGSYNGYSCVPSYEENRCCKKIDEYIFDIHNTLNKLERTRRTTVEPGTKDLDKFLKNIEDLRAVMEGKDIKRLIGGKGTDIAHLVSEIQKAIFGGPSGQPNYALIRDLISRAAKDILGTDVAGRFDNSKPVGSDKMRMKELVEEIRKDEDKLQALDNLYNYIFVG